LSVPTRAQISTSFELRYFSKDKAAIGVNDFKGEKEFLNTDQRIEFLETYAEVASRWFLDSALNTKVNSKDDIKRFLGGLKEQPLPVERRRIPLESWKSAGIQPENSANSREAVTFWSESEGVQIREGNLQFNQTNVKLSRPVDSLQWRFHLSWKAKTTNNKMPLSIALKDRGRIIAESGFHTNGSIFFTEKGFDRMGEAYIPGKWYRFKLEVDLHNDRYNILINDNKVGDWIALNSSSMVDEIIISGGEGIKLDDLTGLKFDTAGCNRKQPYTIAAFLNESFDDPLSIKDWAEPEYDDLAWEDSKLPLVHGGELEAGEDLFLRTRIHLGEIQKAWLNIEALDPGGEVWINGRIVFVTHKRNPIRIDISEFLEPYSINTLAIRVFAFQNQGPLYHSPLDRNIGWFCGRAWLDLTSPILISQVKVYTKKIRNEGKQAEQIHHLVLNNTSDHTFEGSASIEYYPWHPYEGSKKIASFEVPVQVFAKDTIHLIHRGSVNDPQLWTHDQPNLYRVHCKIKSENEIIDDELITTGIRTVSQENGIFRINGEAELLGGAQTMGFRMPVENISKWNRCPPAGVLADELLACKKIGNALRIHVHAGGTYAYSVNDPRIAEMADQLGLMIIWPTTSWIREGEWGGIDFEGYPLYMDQVYNHPSIIMWEGANHPNRFKGKPLEYSNRFITKIVNTILSADSSRLISPTSYNRHFAYRNDRGTLDQDGNTIVPCKEWTHPLVVRGNQDALTGYGAEWQKIRNFPDPYRSSFIESKERAYFNFEHEESIGMQNFSLARGMPWYEMPSYENIYDVGSIGREFEFREWRASQAWQAFSAWESMKWQRIIDVDGFSWCCLHGGPNSGTYRKPLIDALGHAKLSFYANQMALQDILAGSANTDVIYHRKDELVPVILNLGEERRVKLKILVRNLRGEEIDSREFENVLLEEGRTVKQIPPFRPKFSEEGYYVIEYYVLSS